MLRHLAVVANFRISTNRGPANTSERNEKLGMFVFPVDDCTQEQNGSPLHFFHRTTLQMAVSVRKDCSGPEILQPW